MLSPTPEALPQTTIACVLQVLKRSPKLELVGALDKLVLEVDPEA